MALLFFLPPLFREEGGSINGSLAAVVSRHAILLCD